MLSEVDAAAVSPPFRQNLYSPQPASGGSARVRNDWPDPTISLKGTKGFPFDPAAELRGAGFLY
jgi:hypothetical protein